MKVVYVTGCLGFIGSYVTRACLKKGWQFRGVDKMTYASNDALLDDFNHYPNFVFEPKDIKDMSFEERGKYFSTQTTDSSTVKGPKPGSDNWTIKSVSNAKIYGAPVGEILAWGFDHKDYKKAYDYTQKFQGDPPSKKKAAK